MATELATHNPHDLAPSESFVAVVERLATNPEVDPGKLEHLLNLQERILNRNALTAFNAAFAEMQAEMPAITERGEIKVNGQVRSKYATFEDINDAVKPILKKHGFAVMFKTKTEGGKITVWGVLMHRDGHREETDMTLDADTSGSKNSVQSIGSSVSYAKRYVMCALLNITSRGEDDDGYSGGTALIGDNQVADLEALITEVKADRAAFLKFLKVSRLEDLPAAKYSHAVKALEAKRGK